MQSDVEYSNVIRLWCVKYGIKLKNKSIKVDTTASICQLHNIKIFKL